MHQSNLLSAHSTFVFYKFVFSFTYQLRALLLSCQSPVQTQKITEMNHVELQRSFLNLRQGPSRICQTRKESHPLKKKEVLA